MLQDRRYLMVHGHFYQPPRENPWTGRIEPQPSAAPWPNWNSRIAAECYLPMARSRVLNAHDRIATLVNNYANTSFNFGPTLLSWMEEEIPEMLAHLREAAASNRSTALSQAYSHLMLPLADSRDRHAQILWGIREFYWRFGFYPKGMWLPECGIDRETLRALIDHGMRFVILSPHQASKARPFGEIAWRDVSMGRIDSRRAYRLFETDGGGRTHFNRWVDVVFYTPGLNLKVSFNHILNQPEELARELNACFDAGADEAQLVSIVTDGEIYGHHEKNGEEALTRLFGKIAPALGLKVCTAEEFIAAHPPAWEVKLWSGEDGNGTSWSCQHGMGRWSRDCGCSSKHGPDWTQEWRRPLRDAFDNLRDRIRQVCRRELGSRLWDVDDARNEYVEIVLDPRPARRRAFLGRHAQRRLQAAEQGVVWRLLEADRNAMLMYTSCGWFFDELSGLEPVQNMRYALRAAELAQPFSQDDLEGDLCALLAKAKSNLPRFGDGCEIFRRLVKPSAYTDAELAAGAAMCLALDLPPDNVTWRVVATDPVFRGDKDGGRAAWGTLTCHDDALDRRIETGWFANLNDLAGAGVILNGFTVAPADCYANTDADPSPPALEPDWLGEMTGLPPAGLETRIGRDGVAADRLPGVVKGGLYREFGAASEKIFFRHAGQLGLEGAEVVRRAQRYGAEAPTVARAGAVFAVENEIEEAVYEAIAAHSFDEAMAKVLETRKTAEELDFWASQDAAARAIAFTLREILYWLGKMPAHGWLEGLRPVDLDGTYDWLAPAAPVNRRDASPRASRFAEALGVFLAKWRKELLAGDNLCVDALTTQAMPELLAFAEKGGFVIPGDTGVVREFWNFLATPLSRLLTDDPADMVAGEPGERLRLTGQKLGFSDEAMDKRLLEAAWLAMNREGGV